MSGQPSQEPFEIRGMNTDIKSVSNTIDILPALKREAFSLILRNTLITMSGTTQTSACPRLGDLPSTRQVRETVVPVDVIDRIAVATSSTSTIGIRRPHRSPNRCDRSFDSPERHGP